MKEVFTPIRLNILSQLFTNLAAGWFGVVIIIPGITQLNNLGDILWLIKNLVFGMIALFIADRLAERGGK